MKISWARIVAGLSVTAAIALAFLAWTRSSNAAVADAERVLGLEDTSDWSASPGATLSPSELRTQGTTSIQVTTVGYSTVTSRLLGPLGQVADTVSLDVQLPTEQPNEYWYGDIQLFVSSRSQGVYSAFIGQRSLNSIRLGEFTEIAFSLPTALRKTLSAEAYDIEFTIALNVPAGTARDYLLDNLQVGSSLPPRTTINSGDVPRILGFESDRDWSLTTGTATLSNANKTQGNASLAITGGGYSVLESLPMTDLGKVDSRITVDLRLPSDQPNPYWQGAVQLFIDLPSKGLWNLYLDQSDLTGLDTEKFLQLAFDLPAAVQATLNAGGYADLRFRLALNVPAGPQTYFFDNFQVGEITDPVVQPIIARNGALVGRASSGYISITVDGKDAEPEFENGIFRVVSEDGLCVPSPTNVCRFVVETVRLKFRDIDIAGQNFKTGIIRNDSPFRISIGGFWGMSGFVPSDVKWTVFADSIVAPLTTSIAFMTIDPSGGGMISLFGLFGGSFEGVDVSVGGSVTADSPLLNRLPIAEAGPKISVTVPSGCLAQVALDSSGSFDPDDNIVAYRWIYRGITAGEGPKPSVNLNRGGNWNIELRVTDEFGAVSTDSVEVDVNLPSGCPAL